MVQLYIPPIQLLCEPPKWFVTGLNEVLAKVIFSQASVIHSVHSGGGVPPNFWGVSKFSGGCLVRGGVWSRGVSNFSGGMCLQFFGRGSLQIFGGGGSPPEYGQRSAGTHPTGMHSCYFMIFHWMRCNEIDKKSYFSEIFAGSFTLTDVCIDCELNNVRDNENDEMGSKPIAMSVERHWKPLYHISIAMSVSFGVNPASEVRWARNLIFYENVQWLKLHAGAWNNVGVGNFCRVFKLSYI